MIDLSNKIELRKNKKVLTYDEYIEKFEKGDYKNNEEFEYFTPFGNIQKCKVVCIPITSLVSGKIEYHQKTNWKYIDDIYIKHRKLWNIWKKDNLIPKQIINKMIEDYGV